MSDRIETELIVSALAKGFPAIEQALARQGASVGELQRMHNLLAKAQADADVAARKLADAHVRLNNAIDPDEQMKFRAEVAAAQVALDREGQEVLELTRRLDAMSPEALAAAAAQDKLERQTEEASRALKNQSSIQSVLRGTFTELNSQMQVAQQVIGAVTSVVNSAIAPVIEYGNRIRDLGAFAGITSEEASRLIQVTDDLGVEFNTLRTAAKAMAENGIQPSVANLADLADKFNSIQDPVKQSQFLVDQFGARAGPGMAYALQQGSAALIKMGIDAEKTGLVVGDDFVQQTEAARKAIDNWEDSVLSAKVALSQTLLPAVGALLDYMSGWLQFWGRTATKVTDAAQSMLGMNDAIERQTSLFNAITPQTSNYSGVLQGLTVEVERNWGAWGQWADMIEQAHTDYLASQAKLEADNTKLLQAGLSGDVTGAFEDYQSVLAQTGPEIERLNAEIAKYTRQQGMSITVENQATTSQKEYRVAALEAAEAQRKLAEYTGDSELELARLDLAAERAQEKVVKLGEGMGTSETFTLNYTKKLAELNSELDDNVAKNEAAAMAMEESIRQFVYQQLAVEGDAAANLILARNLGLIDEASYQAATVAMNLKQSYEDGKISAENFGVSADLLAQAIARLQDKEITVTTIYNEIHKITIEEAVQAAGGQGGGVTPGTYDPKPTGNLGPGAAHGLESWVVPPGYPNDSFPMRVQSGERVTVEPAGQWSGGGGANGATIIFEAGSIVAGPNMTPDELFDYINRKGAERLRGLVGSGGYRPGR